MYILRYLSIVIIIHENTKQSFLHYIFSKTGLQTNKRQPLPGIVQLSQLKFYYNISLYPRKIGLIRQNLPRVPLYCALKSKDKIKCNHNATKKYITSQNTMTALLQEIWSLHFKKGQYPSKIKVKVKVKVKQSHYRPGQALRFRLPDFKTIGAWRW
jgi:hypothetical protein